MFHYSKINMKPPAIGSVVEWHQDLSYYPLTHPGSVSILFYLDDADTGNGCLQVIPGAHRRPLLDHTRNGIFQGCVTDPALVASDRERFGIELAKGARAQVSLYAKPGEAFPALPYGTVVELEAMLGRDENAVRLRQSAPFVGLLPKEQVRKLNEEAAG